MPEGPEVRREADAVARALAGRKAREVWFFHERLKPFEPLLSGSRVRDVTSRGKAMLIRFGGGLVIVTHNQLYGKWMVRHAGVEPRTRRSLRLAIRNASHAALQGWSLWSRLRDGGRLAPALVLLFFVGVCVPYYFVMGGRS